MGLVNYIKEEGNELEAKSRKDAHLRLFCFIPIPGGKYNLKGEAVNRTWGPRCDQMMYAGDYDNITYHIRKMGKPGWNRLWSKTRDSFVYLHDNHLQQFDWFYKADDNTFLLVENLKWFLRSYDPELPWFFGHRLRGYFKVGCTFNLENA